MGRKPIQPRALTGLLAIAGSLALGSTGAAAEKVIWSPCALEGVEGRAECARIAVPENRSHPASRQIELRTARLLPLGAVAAPDPIFVLQGGPGQSAVGLASFYGGESWAAARQKRIIVLVDQRGTGGSNPLDCPSADRDDNPQSYLGEMFPAELIAACRKSVAERADPSQYTTEAAVDDLEFVRASLGYEAVNLYGTSYGTRVALAYLDRFPSRVRSLVLKGVIEPQSVLSISFAEDTERSIKLLIADCAADAQCAAAYPKLDESYARLRDQLGKGPVAASVGAGEVKSPVTLSKGVVASAIRSALQATPYAARLPRAIHAAGHGDYSPLADLVLSIRKAGESAVSTGLMLSVICSEDLPRLARHAPSKTFLGSYWEERVRVGCAAWNVPPVATPFRTPRSREVPALMISGFLDPATPPWHAESAAKALPKARQVVVRNGSHSFAGMKGCVDLLIAAFLENPGAPLEASCADRIKRPSFE